MLDLVRYIVALFIIAILAVVFVTFGVFFALSFMSVFFVRRLIFGFPEDKKATDFSRDNRVVDVDYDAVDVSDIKDVNARPKPTKKHQE